MNGIKWGRVASPKNKIKNIIIVASGPSVNAIDFNLLKNKKDSFIITVNGAGNHVPFADAWFTLDPWGLANKQIPRNGFKGALYAAVPEDYGLPTAKSIQHRITPKQNITYLHRLQSHNFTNVSSETAYKIGLSEDTSCINTGNSGYGALNLAYHMRPENIYLLGVDGTIGYFYTNKERNRPLTYLPLLFKSAIPRLSSAGINVYNVSPTSMISCFPKIDATQFHKIMSEQK